MIPLACNLDFWRGPGRQQYRHRHVYHGACSVIEGRVQSTCALSILKHCTYKHGI